MSTSSWVGSVWSFRGDKGPVIGQVRSVEGKFLTLAVVGLEGQVPEGVEVLPPDEAGALCARVSSEALLGRWKRMGVVPA